MGPKSFVLISSLLALLAGSARADGVDVEREHNPYARRHVYLGAEGVASIIVNQTGPHQLLTDGGGVNLFIGGRVHRAVALEFGWQPTFHSQPSDLITDSLGRPASHLTLSALTLDLKLFPLRRAIQPFVSFGPAFYVLHDWSIGYIASGPGWQAGAGIDFWLLPVLSLGMRVQYRGAQLFDYDGRGDATYLSMLNAGLNFTGHF
jgi:hypothetical protein